MAATLVIYFANLLLSTWVPLIKILTTLTSPNHTIRFKHILNSVPVQDRLQPMLRFQEELQIFWGRGLFVVGSCRNEDKILSRYQYEETAPKNIRFCGVYIPPPRFNSKQKTSMHFFLQGDILRAPKTQIVLGTRPLYN